MNALLSLISLTSIIGHINAEECLTPRACNQITDKTTCLSSRDSRPGQLNEPCTWCDGTKCTTNNGNKCEPVEWLYEQNNISPELYTIASTGLTPRTCPQITDASTCLSSKDNRAEYLNQPCVWCAAGPCTTNNNNRCEPAKWLFQQNQLNEQHYEVAVACRSITGDCLNDRQCYDIQDIETCLSSKDNRASYLNQPCTWCDNGACTGNNGNKCEPVEWLFEHNNQINPGEYETASSGLESRVCYQIQDKETCLQSKDSRATYIDQPCVWCNAGQCTDNNNRCEPVGWLFARADQRNPQEYEVAVACTDVQVTVPSAYQSQYTNVIDRGSISCGETKTGTRNSEHDLVVYQYEATGSQPQVYLEGCDSVHDIWLFLFDANGNSIYNADDQRHFGDQAGCGNYFAGDITVTDSSNLPNPIPVSAGDKYYFGIGGWSSATGDYSVTLECGSEPAAKSEFSPEFLGDINDNNEFTIEVSQSTFMIIAGLVALVLVINIGVICLRVCGNHKSKGYAAVKYDTDTEFADSEANLVK